LEGLSAKDEETMTSKASVPHDEAILRHGTTFAFDAIGKADAGRHFVDPRRGEI
jgi:hypothetical protein